MHLYLKPEAYHTLVEEICRSLCKAAEDDPDEAIYEYEGMGLYGYSVGPWWTKYSDKVIEMLVPLVSIDEEEMEEVEETQNQLPWVSK